MSKKNKSESNHCEDENAAHWLSVFSKQAQIPAAIS